MRLLRLLLSFTAGIHADSTTDRVPSPASFLGFEVGADRKLADWHQISAYFNQLALVSDRVRVDTLGTSTLGRPFILLTISSPENLRRLDEYRAIQRKLADPRTIASAEERRRLLEKGRVIVCITSAIHAVEVGSGQAPLRIAYRLAHDSGESTQRILREAIILLIPSLNPDGLQAVVDWYQSTVGYPWEGTGPPFLYHPYVGHDNNRDWYTFTQQETQLAVTKVFNVWHPQITYDVHQQGPFASRIFVPPWLDPVDPNIDAIIAQESNEIGASMAADLTAAGKKGVAINAMYDLWTASRGPRYHGFSALRTGRLTRHGRVWIGFWLFSRASQPR